MLKTKVYSVDRNSMGKYFYSNTKHIARTNPIRWQLFNVGSNFSLILNWFVKINIEIYLKKYNYNSHPFNIVKLRGNNITFQNKNETFGDIALIVTEWCDNKIYTVNKKRYKHLRTCNTIQCSDIAPVEFKETPLFIPSSRYAPPCLSYCWFCCPCDCRCRPHTYNTEVYWLLYRHSRLWIWLMFLFCLAAGNVNGARFRFRDSHQYSPYYTHSQLVIF